MNQSEREKGIASARKNAALCRVDAADLELAAANQRDRLVGAKPDVAIFVMRAIRIMEDMAKERAAMAGRWSMLADAISEYINPEVLRDHDPRQALADAVDEITGSAPTREGGK